MTSYVSSRIQQQQVQAQLSFYPPQSDLVRIGYPHLRCRKLPESCHLVSSELVDDKAIKVYDRSPFHEQ
jgi:hypothetical protein